MPFPYLLLRTRTMLMVGFLSLSQRPHGIPALPSSSFNKKKTLLSPLPSHPLTVAPPTFSRTPSFKSFHCDVQLAPISYFLSVEVLLATACVFLEKKTVTVLKLWSSKYIKAGCYNDSDTELWVNSLFQMCTWQSLCLKLLLIIPFKLH